MSAMIERVDVAIIGAGPTGLSAAAELARAGVERVLVLDRERDAGGIPRHCGHSPFGFREFHRVTSGRRYARRLAEIATAGGARLRLNTTVTALADDARIEAVNDQGPFVIDAQRVLLATGTRETPRATRLVGGRRPLGIVTTGTLQAMVHTHQQIPFRRPIIVGTELVAFSALLTCQQASIRARAMLEAGPETAAFAASRWLPRLLRVPVMLSTDLLEILGGERVSQVIVKSADGSISALDCDGVIFSGQFTPESSLVRLAHLELDPLTDGPVVDQFGRCSDPSYFAAGNLLGCLDTAGRCWASGRRVAAAIKASLDGELPATQRACRVIAPNPTDDQSVFKFTPQRIALPDRDLAKRKLELRFTQMANGSLRFRVDGNELFRRVVQGRPGSRLAIPIPTGINSDLQLDFKASQHEHFGH